MGKFTTPGVLYWSAFIPSAHDGSGSGSGAAAVSNIGDPYSCLVFGGKNTTTSNGGGGNNNIAGVDSSHEVEMRQSNGDGDLKMTDIAAKKGLVMLQEDKSALDCSVGWTISSRCNVPIAQYKHSTTDFQSIVEQSSVSSSSPASSSHDKMKLLSSSKQQFSGKDLLTRKQKPSVAFNQKPVVEVAMKVDALDIIINGPKNAFINEPIELTITIVNNSPTDEVKSPTLVTEREYLKRDFSERGHHHHHHHGDSSFRIARSYLIHITSTVLRYPCIIYIY